MDKRAKQRVPKRLLVEIDDGSAVRTGYTSNVSERGMCLIVPRTSPHNGWLKISYQADGHTVTMKGVVRWSSLRRARLSWEPPGGIGVFLPDPPEEYRKLVAGPPGTRG